MKKLFYFIFIILLIIIVPDRVLKFYENKKAQEEKKVSREARTLTAEQQKDYENAIKFVLIPYRVFGLKPNFNSSTVNINSLGLRGSEIKEKEKNDCRIVIIGGSAVFGAEVASDNFTFSKLLEKKLNSETDRHVEIINAGVPAYVSMQELILFTDTLADLKPDVVIVFDGFNDAHTILKRVEIPNHPWWFGEIRQKYYDSITKLFIEKKLRKYRPTKWFLHWLDKRRGKNAGYAVSLEQVGYYKRNLDLMCHLAKSYSMDIMLVFQPVIFYKDLPSIEEQSIIKNLERDYKNALKEMCDDEKSAMKEIAALNAVEFVDGARFFNTVKDDIFIDEAHFNQEGHKIVADCLYEVIKHKINHH